jgi:hypothetical protein
VCAVSLTLLLSLPLLTRAADWPVFFEHLGN